MTRRWKLLISAAATAGLVTFAGCGTQKAQPPTRPWPVVSIEISRGPSSTLLLPIQVASRLNLFALQHVRVRWTHSSASVHIGLAQSQWPWAGEIAQRPDFYLVAPVRDPHFRLRALNRLPVDYPPSLQSARPLIDSIMALNQSTPQLQELPWTELQSLWKHGHLPWAIVNSTELLRLQHIDRQTTVLNWLGSSTGPIPTVAVWGRSPHLPQVLAALNMALWYMHTTPPGTLAPLMSPEDPSAAQRTIRQALHEDLWPPSMRISPAEYNRGRALYGLSGALWPPYFSGVDNVPSSQAFNATS